MKMMMKCSKTYVDSHACPLEAEIHSSKGEYFVLIRSGRKKVWGCLFPNKTTTFVVERESWKSNEICSASVQSSFRFCCTHACRRTNMFAQWKTQGQYHNCQSYAKCQAAGPSSDSLSAVFWSLPLLKKISFVITFLLWIVSLNGCIRLGTDHVKIIPIHHLHHVDWKKKNEKLTSISRGCVASLLASMTRWKPGKGKGV